VAGIGDSRLTREIITGTALDLVIIETIGIAFTFVPGTVVSSNWLEGRARARITGLSIRLFLGSGLADFGRCNGLVPPQSVLVASVRLHGSTGHVSGVAAGPGVVFAFQVFFVPVAHFCIAVFLFELSAVGIAWTTGFKFYRENGVSVIPAGAAGFGAFTPGRVVVGFANLALPGVLLFGKPFATLVCSVLPEIDGVVFAGRRSVNRNYTRKSKKKHREGSWA
jgi:hypothetical protein